ncbi:MAG TPA: flavin reductase family protein [Phycisphaerae bacterium]
MSKTDAIYEAMGRIPSGIAILTSRAGDRSTGMLASWFQQAAFAPPLITVAIHKGRYIEELIGLSGKFVLNLLPERPGSLMRHFARGFGPDEDAFAGLQVANSNAGPVLRGAAAHLLCKVQARHDAGDHYLYLAEAKGGAVTTQETSYIHRRRSGATY